jgi:hypothetical protein
MRTILTPVIVTLALLAGLIHLLLVLQLFVFAPSGPPPGASAAQSASSAVGGTIRAAPPVPPAPGGPPPGAGRRSWRTCPSSSC